MRDVSRFAILLCAVLIFPALLAAKDSAGPPQWKALVVGKVTARPGVDASDEEQSTFQQGELKKLRKENLAGLIVAEGETLAPESASDSVYVESVFTAIEAAHFPVGGSMEAEITLYRLSDHQTLMTYHYHLRGAVKGHDWSYLGADAINKVIEQARTLPPLASFAPAAPEVKAKAETPSAVAAAAPPPAGGGGETLTNDDIVKMVGLKIPEDVIIAKIGSSANRFDLSTAGLADLTQKGVSPAIMKAMLAGPRAAAAPPPTAPPPVAESAGAASAPKLALPYRAVEVRQLTLAPGVELPGKLTADRFLPCLSDKLGLELKRLNVASDVLAAGAAASDADASSLVVVGEITQTKTEGHGAFNPPSITLELKFLRRSDGALIETNTQVIEILNSMLVDDVKTASFIVPHLTWEIKKALK